MTDERHREPPPGWHASLTEGECSSDFDTSGFPEYMSLAEAWAEYDRLVAPALAQRLAEVREWLIEHAEEFAHEHFSKYSNNQYSYSYDAEALVDAFTKRFGR